MYIKGFFFSLRKIIYESVMNLDIRGLFIFNGYFYSEVRSV